MKRAKHTPRSPVAWYLVGGLISLGLTILMIREDPAIRRELRILRM